jgi:catecholate siderophore receptor
MRTRLLFAIIALRFFQTPCLQAAGAEPPPFSLRGRVLDPARSGIAGARVTAIPDGRGSWAGAISDDRGAFLLKLVAGHYRFRILAEGFQESSFTLDAPPGGEESREIVLDLAAVLDTLTVRARASYDVSAITSGTKTLTPLRDVPQSVTVVTRQLIRDQQMTSMADVVRYMPGVAAHQGENNRDQVIIRGNSSSADFFVDGVRDDVQYYRDLYNLERVEALKGPNAMVFGRGGGGGVINRVTKAAGINAMRDVTLQAGAYSHKRVTADLQQPLNERVSFRLNQMYENSGSFRDAVGLERYGTSPTVTVAPDAQTTLTLGYEHFHDSRVADRGVPSFRGLPLDVDVSTFFGNPSDSHVHAGVDLGSAAIVKRLGDFTVHGRTLFGNYDRSYQNFVPGSVVADGSQTVLTAYNSATRRRNFFNQTDLTRIALSGRVRHMLLAGVEVGRQVTSNFRNTGFFNNSATSIFVPLASPTVNTPVVFRQSATDANNDLRTNVAAAFAQDQIELSQAVQVITGLRFDYFDLQYHNKRNGDELRRIDRLVSPRAGIVLKPVTRLSIYGTYSKSYLPSSGDQFSSLTTITQQAEPERFNNYEVGTKWDVAEKLALTTAVYRLNRTNTRATDPADPTRIVQTGSQRTNGWELGWNGRITDAWQIAGGYAYQRAFVTSATTAAKAGAQVAQVPHHTLSFWNNYQLFPKVGAGLGFVHRSDMYAAIDNTVTLPGYTDVDAALYVSVTSRIRVQANVENIFDTTYYINADNNTNISPGSPRAIRVGLTTRF